MNNKNIPDVLLERFLLGELDEQSMSEIELELTRNPELQKRLEAFRESNHEILSAYSPEKIAAAIYKKAKAPRINESPDRKTVLRRKKNTWKIPAFALGALGVTAIVISLIPEYSLRYRTFLELEETRLKGNTTKLFIYRKKDNQIELLSSHSQVKQNDLIQIGYFSERDRYGMIFSIDGRGNVTLHFPDNTPEAELLESNKKVLLNNSYELDDAPFYETFYFVTSPKKFSVTQTIENMQKVIDAQKKADPDKKEFLFETPAEMVSVALDKVR